MERSDTLSAPIPLVGQIAQQFGRTLARLKGNLPAGNDWDLWHRACAGSESSARALVRQLTPGAHHLALQIVRNDHDAQDMVQEAFLRLWQSRPSDAQGARLSTYFNTIVINRCKTLLTRRQELATEPEALIELADGHQLSLQEQPSSMPEISAVRLQRALDQLPPRQRLALAMWAYADADVREIARTLEIDTNAAHQLLFRAKAALRHHLQGGST